VIRETVSFDRCSLSDHQWFTGPTCLWRMLVG
jgi:hypothetical protein